MTVEMPQTDEAIRRATGKGWDEWRQVLDAWDSPQKTHTEIAAYLARELGVADWWAQGVTVGYERLIGRREAGQRNDGTYSASVSKTIAADIERVHAALVDDAARAAWLGDGVVRFRTASPPKSARFDDLEHGMIIAFFLTGKGADKCAVQVEATKLASADAGDAWKAAWRPRLQALAEYLARPSS